MANPIQSSNPSVRKVRARRNSLAKFVRDTVIPYDGDECFIWPYGRGAHGRAMGSTGSASRFVSRTVCEAAHGPPPTPKHEAAHSCGRGHEGCVAKRHLRWATPAENQADRTIHGTSNRGSRHGMGKLTEDDVRQIRMLQGTLFHREIADLFGVSREAIGLVLRGERWRWLDAA